MSDTQAVQFRRIGWRQTLDVSRLSKALLPTELCRKTHSLFALLVNLERRNHNLSFGLYVGDKMVGYMLVYFHDRSLYHNRDELIVHIDEYCVESEYRGRGRDVITQMFREIDLWKPRCGIEAIATGDALQHWLGIGRIVAHWGYETNLRENDCMRAGHSMGRLRWEYQTEKPWKLETASKMPKPSHTLELKGVDHSVVKLGSQRQLLSIKSAYEQMSEPGAGVSASFNYLWQWWRFFGLSEELSVLVVIRGDAIIGIAPLSYKHSSQPGKELTLSMIGDDSGFPCPQPKSSKSNKDAFIAVLNDFFKQQATQDKIYTGVNADALGLLANPSEAPDLNNCAPITRLPLGLNRREVELRQAFLKAIVTD